MDTSTTLVSLLSNLMRKRDGWCTVMRKFLRKAKDNSELFRPMFALASELWRSLTTIENSNLSDGLSVPKRTVKLPITQLKLLLPIEQIPGNVDDLRSALLLIENILVVFKADKKLQQLLQTRLDNSVDIMREEISKNGTSLESSNNNDPVVISTASVCDNLANNLIFLYEKLLEVVDNGDAEPGSVVTIDWSTVTVDPLPQAEGIVTQYGSRNVYMLSEDCDDHLKLNYWLGFTTCDEDLEREQIPCDLQDLAKMCLIGDTNLTADCKRLLHLSASPHSNRDRLTTAPCFRTRRVEVEPSTGRPEKKIFV
uniref:Uncharacterized protein n=1 Tax=Anopheles atroparvus TaxID=41427 RepID=A0AAG5D1T3_ANOAO